MNSTNPMRLKIKKGLNLRLEGAVVNQAARQPVTIQADLVAVIPDDFEGFIPKTDVRVGQKVSLGESILHHKNDPRIKLVSPVGGTVVAIERGERRHIERVVIERDKDFNTNSRQFDINALSGLSAVEWLAENGLLAMIRRRPYADIPRADILPRDIFVTGFDSAPLAVSRVWSDGDLNDLQCGASILSRITTGKVYVCSRNSEVPNLHDVENVAVSGPHPACLPGVQAAQIAPVNKGETIWTLSADTMWRIGRLALTGRFDASTVVAVTGSCVEKPCLVKTTVGASVEPILKNNLKPHDFNIRVISGNVLTGTAVDPISGFLHFPYTQITVIPEGDDVDEFMGWASISPAKMSVNPSFPGWLFRRFYRPDARINGGRRAMIMSGEYDRVVPMDILVEYLIKAILSRNIEQMEKLGIYEVAPEDFALAEFVDSSKLPLQQIVRQGLDFLRKELE